MNAATQPTVRLRLTRRGRRAIALFLAALALGAIAAGLALTADGAQASAESGGQEFQYLVVEPGQTLWGIASDLDPSLDPRDVIADVVRLNQLPSSELMAGQRIAIPLTYAAPAAP